MCSTMNPVLQPRRAFKTFNVVKTLGSITYGVVLGVVLGLTGFAMAVSPASALVTGAGGSLQQRFKENGSAVEVNARRGGAAHRTTVVGPRGGVASRTVVRGGAVVRPGYHGGGVRWARPGRYHWPRGGAIAAGAAIGFVTAATAAAWAGAAPAPGMCWYYTDMSRTQGFWDYCQ
jgi:hypothetical protein